MITKEKVLLTDETLAKRVRLFPLALERKISKVEDQITGTNHSVVTVGDSRVHFLHTGEGTTLAESKDIFVVDVVIRREEDVWF